MSGTGGLACNRSRGRRRGTWFHLWDEVGLGHASPLLAHCKFVDTLSGMIAALMGYRGCGKTTIGKRIADRLWARFVDIDDRIVKAAGGKSIRDIFLEYGEPY